MGYDLEFERPAENDLSRLDTGVERRVREKINDMAASAESWQHVALSGQFRGEFRLRVGNYRVR